MYCLFPFMPCSNALCATTSGDFNSDDLDAACWLARGGRDGLPPVKTIGKRLDCVRTQNESRHHSATDRFVSNPVTRAYTAHDG
jgi:hypothetical protein